VPSMLGMSKMSTGLIKGIPRAPLMVGYMAGLEANGGRYRCWAQNKVRNHGSASNANDTIRDVGLLPTSLNCL
jgi:hypothetical protein